MRRDLVQLTSQALLGMPQVVRLLQAQPEASAVAAEPAQAYRHLTIRDQLKSLSATIPETTDEEDEGLWTIHGELRGIGECAIEALDDLIRELQGGAFVTSERLHDQWRTWRQGEDQFRRRARSLGLLPE